MKAKYSNSGTLRRTAILNGFQGSNDLARYVGCHVNTLRYRMEHEPEFFLELVDVAIKKREAENDNK